MSAGHAARRRKSTHQPEQTGFDLLGEHFDRFHVADIKGASSVEIADGQLVITIWKPGEGQRVVRGT